MNTPSAERRVTLQQGTFAALWIQHQGNRAAISNKVNQIMDAYINGLPICSSSDTPSPPCFTPPEPEPDLEAFDDWLE